MREILFRGKDVKENWHIGLLAKSGNGWYISNSAGIPLAYEVIPSTVGQFTGLTDKNGKKIFEGDIIKIPDDYEEFGHNAGEIYEIYFNSGGFRLKPKYYLKVRGYWLEDDRTFEVIGNIHDNQKKMEEGGE